LNWFFRHAPQRRFLGPKIGTNFNHPQDEVSQDGRRRYGLTLREMQRSVPIHPLLQETIRLMRIRQMAYRTEETYLGWLRRFESFSSGKKDLSNVGEDDLKSFLTHLAVQDGVSASTQRQALNAGVFFLREVRKIPLGDFSDFIHANPKKYFPVVYSRDEIRRLLDSLPARWRLMAQLQYGCGLRISELCGLRVKDLDLDRGKLTIRGGKGNKDRCVPLPRSLMKDIEAHLLHIQRIHDTDRQSKQPGVYLPPALERKMPKAGERWEWFWVFPAKGFSRDPRGAETAPPRRHHVHSGVYQKALWDAAQIAKIPKRSNSHALRHSYATHLLEDGVNIRTVQEFLGHAQVETTMIYLHVMEDQRDRISSPLDRVINPQVKQINSLYNLEA
jgi:integron integrase